MPYLNIIQQLNSARRQDLAPLLLATNGKCVGWTWQENIARLKNWGVNLTEKTGKLLLPNHSPAELNAQLAAAAEKMRAENYLEGWRDELLAIQESFSPRPPVAVIERAAACVLGIKGYGVHLNGFCEQNGFVQMWLARRSLQKAVEPGKVDQIVAGGIPVGISVLENLQKECQEEANISPADIAANARAVSLISYQEQLTNGVRNDVIFNYDLRLPPDFVPQNNDGEVMEFLCLPLPQVAEWLRDEPSAFKRNSAVVIIDFLIRHGVITPDDRDYEEICWRLRVDLSLPPEK